MTDYATKHLLNSLFGGQLFDPPPMLYVGLSLTRAYRGGYFAEPKADCYARVAIPNTMANFVAECGQKSNAAEVVFARPLSEWGRICSVFIADAPQGGNVLAAADLPAPREIGAHSEPPRIAVGGLTVSMY